MTTELEANATPESPLLRIENLRVTFNTPGRQILAVRGISFDVEAGERVGMVGESGSGKSATALAIMRLLPRATSISGRVLLNGVDLLSLSPDEMRVVRARSIGIVYQDPFTALNPVLTVGQQIAEVVETHFAAGKRFARNEAETLLHRVGISRPRERLNDYPHQFSGGMRQRVMIAIALAGHPRLVIADEPTTALDVTIQAQILELLLTLTEEDDTALLLITHDLAVIARAIERVNVMYAGHIVERAGTSSIFYQPRHPYTRALLAALPRVDAAASEFLSIPGEPPDPSHLDPGCPFVDRCERPLQICSESLPTLTPSDASGDLDLAACWNPIEP